MGALVDWLQAIQGGAAVAGLAVLLLAEQVRPFMDHFRGSRRAWATHLTRNVGIGLLNSAVVALAFAGLWVASAEWAAENGIGLLNVLFPSGGEPALLHGIAAILLLDAWTYLWHRLNHRIPFLWRFHRVHHADNRMDVTTAGRFHTGEIVLSSLLRIPVIVVLGVYAWELIAYEALMFAVVQFHHANIGLPGRLDRSLRTVIVTPAMHKVHHSRLRAETDSNYSALFSIWDRLFRSFRLRDNPAEIDFGLDDFDDPHSQSFRGMLSIPMRRTRGR